MVGMIVRCKISDLPGKDISNNALGINKNYNMRDGRNHQSGLSKIQTSPTKYKLHGNKTKITIVDNRSLFFKLLIIHALGERDQMCYSWHFINS